MENPTNSIFLIICLVLIHSHWTKFKWTYGRGPTPLKSVNGLVDDFSHYTWIFPLKPKGDAITVYKKFE